VCRNSRSRKNSPKYIPGDNLLRKFNRWRKPSRGEYSNQLQPTTSAPSLIPTQRDRSRNGSRNPSREHSPDRSSRPTIADPERDIGISINREEPAAGVDRNTSVRSVMTLPAYSASARPSEQILAREGERGGIDVVLEFPETVDEEEMRRDDEMESLYQIRRARREEQAEREDRRRQRREARARGDYQTLQRLQRESRQRAETAAANETITSAALIAEHQAAQQSRERRVSSVQYGGVGVARHDGSRLRANSTDSDNLPLLDSAASMSGSLNPSVHTRGRSASSVLSLSSVGSDDGHGTPRISPPVGPDENGFEFVSLEPRSRAHSHASSTSRISRSPNGERDVTDLGIQIPTEQPPHYDELSAGPWGEAPPYSSPVQTRAPQLPSLAHVPSIEVTSVVSPVSRTQTPAS
jgi:hypothetical protein